MNSSVAIHLRVPLEQAKILKRGARLHGDKLATFVRRMAVRAAEQTIKDHEELALRDAMRKAQEQKAPA